MVNKVIISISVVRRSAIAPGCT